MSSATDALLSPIELWDDCLKEIKKDIPKSQYDLWLAPLQREADSKGLHIYAPNILMIEKVDREYLNTIKTLMAERHPEPPAIYLTIGAPHVASAEPVAPTAPSAPVAQAQTTPEIVHDSNINERFIFENFVEGKSNQLARAAAVQVAANPGKAYNPLFLCGGVGLGKTHLAHAVGNTIKAQNPAAKVVYLHSERFVADMVKALQNNAMDKI